mgnify:CR=1 FL=1|tara:strand:+ start:1416 stop:1688 length:273 start_codon:yes stop_codon:yes gene_type:complete
MAVQTLTNMKNSFKTYDLAICKDEDIIKRLDEDVICIILGENFRTKTQENSPAARFGCAEVGTVFIWYDCLVNNKVEMISDTCLEKINLT